MNNLTTFLLNAGIASIEDVGLYADPGSIYSRIFMLFTSKEEAMRSMNRASVSAHNEGEDNEGEEYWTVEGGYGDHGYGALCYLIAMQCVGSIASDKDRDSSDNASTLWKRFYDDPRIDKILIPERKRWKVEHLRYRYEMKVPFFTIDQINEATSTFINWKNGWTKAASKLTNFLLSAGIASIDEVALVMDRGMFKIYKNKNVDRLHDTAYIIASDEFGYWEVERAEGEHGYGALCYLIAMQMLGGLSPGGVLSRDAVELWRHMINDPRIHKKPIDRNGTSDVYKYYYTLKSPVFTEQQIADAVQRAKEWGFE